MKKLPDVSDDLFASRSGKIIIVVCVALVLLFAAGKLRYYHGSYYDGKPIVLKDTFSFSDTVVNYNDIKVMTREMAEAKYPQVYSQLQSMGYLGAYAEPFIGDISGQTLKRHGLQ